MRTFGAEAKSAEPLSPKSVAVIRSRKADKAELERWMAKAAGQTTTLLLEGRQSKSPPAPRSEPSEQQLLAQNRELQHQLAALRKQHLNTTQTQDTELQRLRTALASAENRLDKKSAADPLESELTEVRRQLKYANEELSESRQSASTAQAALAGAEAELRRMKSTANQSELRKSSQSPQRQISPDKSKRCHSPKSPKPKQEKRSPSGQKSSSMEDDKIAKMLRRAEASNFHGVYKR